MNESAEGVSEWHPQSGSLRVQAWVYDVINPIIGGLREGIRLLEQGRIPWRAGPQRLERIASFEEYVPYGAEPNVDDLASKEPAFAKLRDDHRLAYHALHEACIAAQHTLCQDVKLKADLEARASRASQDLSEPMPGWVVDFVIGRVTKLGREYSVAEFWNEHGPALIQQAEAHVMGPARAAAHLLEVDREILGELQSLRTGLCDRHDIPAAPRIPR